MEVTDLGPTQLKNIERPIRAYSLQVGVPAQAKPARKAKPAPSPARPPGRPWKAIVGPARLSLSHAAPKNLSNWANRDMRKGRRAWACITVRATELAIPMGPLADFLRPDGWPRRRHPVAA